MRWLVAIARRWLRRSPPSAAGPRDLLTEVRTWPTQRIGWLMHELLRGAAMVPGGDRNHSLQVLVQVLREREDDTPTEAHSATAKGATTS
jgi:hypothetical protein